MEYLEECNYRANNFGVNLLGQSAGQVLFELQQYVLFSHEQFSFGLSQSKPSHPIKESIMSKCYINIVEHGFPELLIELAELL